MKAAFITLFVLFVLLGFTPWESIFPIQINSTLIGYLTGAVLGFIGLIGLSCLAILEARKSDNKFVFPLIVMAAFVSVFALVGLFCCLVIPDFKWKDEAVYKNNSDYLIVQEFEGFVTSSMVKPRVVLTKSPFSPIRIVEIRDDYDNAAVEKDTLVYKGRVWVKQP